MNKDISTGAIPEKSHFNNSIEDALQKRVEKIEMILFEVTAILSEFGSIKKLFQKDG